MTKRATCKSLAACLVCVVFVGGAPSHAIDHASLNALLEHTRGQQDMPGLRAAVRLADGRTLASAVGLADVEANVPLDTTVGMPGGSTGKTFVAALTLLLAEENVLHLDDKASRFLGEEDWFQRLPNASALRVEHLLSHTAGLGDYPGSIRFNATMVWRVLRHGTATFTPEELIGYARTRQPLYPLGDGFAYSDAGYLVLGRVIEAATGREYYDLLEERVLSPLHLDQVWPQNQTVLPNITPSYTGGARNLKKDGRMKLDPSSEWTGGGLVTNPAMLVSFFAALGEGRVVSKQSFATMLDSGWRNPRTPGVHYGLGVFVYDEGASFGHSGRWAGYRTRVVHQFDKGLTIAVQTNRDGRVDLSGLEKQIAALAAAGH